MTKNEIKKALYREKPIAKRQKVRRLPKTYLHYHCITTLGVINFKIPIDEGKDFQDKEPAQLLIRWMV